MNGLYQDDFIGKKKSLIGLFQDYEEDNQESRWPNYRLSYPKRAAVLAGGATFLPTQLPSLVAWYPDNLRFPKGMTTDGAASFASASSEYLSVTGWMSQPPFTVSCWLNTAFAATESLWGMVSSGSSYYYYAQFTTNGKVTFFTNGGTNSIVSATAITASTWAHLVITYDGTTANIYINGVNDANSGAISNTGTAITIGMLGTRGGTDRFWNGQIDEFKVFSRVWSQAEVTADYASGNGVSANPADLTAAGISLANYAAGYTFNGPGANLLADRSGNANTLTNNNTATYAAGQVASYTIADGDVVTTWQDQAAPPIKAQGAISLNGSTQYQSIASNSSLQTGNVDFFLSGWMNPGAITDSAPLVFKGTTAGSFTYEYRLQIRTTPSRFQFRITDGVSHFTADSAVVISTGNWYHIFAWYDSVGSKVWISVNNEAPVSGNVTATPQTTTSVFCIGSTAGSAIFTTGSIDDVVMGKPPSPIGTSAGLAGTILAACWAGGNGLAAKDISSAQRTAWGTVSGWDQDNSYNLGRDSIGTNLLTLNAAPTITTGQVKSSTIICGDQTTGNNLTQATAANRPVYKVNIQNGRPVVRGNATNSLFLANASFAPFASQFTLFGMAIPQNVNNNKVFAGCSLANGLSLGFAGTAVLAALQNGGAIGHSSTTYTAAACVVGFWSAGGQASPLTVNVRLNGGADDTASVNITATAADFRLFEGTGGNYFQNDIGEVAVYNVQLGATQRTQLYNYLKSLWGTP